MYIYAYIRTVLCIKTIANMCVRVNSYKVFKNPSKDAT